MTKEAAVGRPWGFWATTGLAVLVFAAFLAVRIVVGTFFRASMLSAHPGVDEGEFARLLQSNGLFVSVSTLVSGTFGTALIVFFAWIRRGITVRQYFPLTRPDSRVMRFWLIAVACFFAASTGLKLVFGYPFATQFAKDAYSTAVFPLLLWIAVLLAAPVFEEFLFRGFLFAGWSQSKLGVTGAILLTSLLWASVHSQYDLFFVSLVFAFGVFAGLARHRTGSLAVPILVHSVVNLIATIETVIALRS